MDKLFGSLFPHRIRLEQLEIMASWFSPPITIRLGLLSVFYCTDAVSVSALTAQLLKNIGASNGRGSEKNPQNPDAAYRDEDPTPPPPNPDAGYRVTHKRTNRNRPIIDSHRAPPDTPGYSQFNFNLVPAFVDSAVLPKEQAGSSSSNAARTTSLKATSHLKGAVLVRAVNGSAYQAGNGTASTTRNPDVIAFAELDLVRRSGGSPADGDAVSINVAPITAENIVFAPQGPHEACGTQVNKASAVCAVCCW